MKGLTDDMRQWLTDNRETYEFYLLHGIFNDPMVRAAMLSAPVTGADFRREDYALVLEALKGATEVMRSLGRKVPAPPSRTLLTSYLQVAAKEINSDDQSMEEALALVDALGKPEYTEMHHCINVYFEAWYGGVRAKRAAREITFEPVPDVREKLGQIEDALAAAALASRSAEYDPWVAFVEGTSTEREPRSPTGIPGLDKCLNGGWGKGECYLLFGGTGCGKSIAAAQCALHEAKHNDGYPLIVSTELLPCEYGARIVSCGCTLPINLLQDCENFVQISGAVASGQASLAKQVEVAMTQKLFRSRIRIAKVGADEGMDARGILKREVLRYEEKYGRPPTWVCLDWLGSVVDLNAAGSGAAAERAAQWEAAATNCVKFAEDTGIPTLVLAQAVNDAQHKNVLTITDIGIAKGIGKNMTAVIGLTNKIDGAASKSAADMSRPMFLVNQFLCVCKSRKGEGRNVRIRREFEFQRFVAPPEGTTLGGSDEDVSTRKPDRREMKRAKYAAELEAAFAAEDELQSKDLVQALGAKCEMTESTAKPRLKEYVELGLVEKRKDGRKVFYSRVAPTCTPEEAS